MDEIPPIWLLGGRIGKRWLDQCVLGHPLYWQDKKQSSSNLLCSKLLDLICFSNSLIFWECYKKQPPNTQENQKFCKTAG